MSDEHLYTAELSNVGTLSKGFVFAKIVNGKQSSHTGLDVWLHTDNMRRVVVHGASCRLASVDKADIALSVGETVLLRTYADVEDKNVAFRSSLWMAEHFSMKYLVEKETNKIVTMSTNEDFLTIYAAENGGVDKFETLSFETQLRDYVLPPIKTLV